MPFPAPSGIVTLTTDFGLEDHYVGVMQGVIARIFPAARIVDISHRVQPYSIDQGAFFVGQSYRYFPPGTVHMAVVDPGVGTSRRALAALADGRYFVAPDNGLLPLALAGLPLEVYAVDAERWGLKPMSSTFHGRDLFAPTAAWLASGKPLSEMGPRVEDWVRLDRPARRVLNIDRFGNVVTSIRPEELDGHVLQAGGARIGAFGETYEQAPAGEPFAIVGSAGLVEISIRQQSAAERLGLSIGDAVSLEPKKA